MVNLTFSSKGKIRNMSVYVYICVCVFFVCVCVCTRARAYPCKCICIRMHDMVCVFNFLNHYALLEYKTIKFLERICEFEHRIILEILSSAMLQ